jgi:hypothetical protein
MKTLHHLAAAISILTLAVVMASTSVAQQSSSVVPTLVNFSGTLSDASGKPLTAIVGVTFYLYKDQEGGSPLWMETQNVQPDKYGHYTVMLGSTSSEGLPTNLFASGEARWLGVQAQGEAEQPRVMLLAVPYALKAGDAATVGGLPPTAFVLAAPNGSSNSTTNSPSNPGSSGGPNVGGSGTQNYLPIWTDSSGDLGNSVLYQTGSGSSAKIGLNLKSPLASLDIGGTELVRGLFETATTGTANASQGFNSNPIDLEASSYNSSTKKAVMQHFEWQSKPTGNNTNNPGATLNLLFGTNNNKPAETGLKLSNAGVFTFAAGQTFPGTGTITGVTAGADLTGGGTSGNVTLNLDTTKVPLLAAANTFTAPQSINSSAIAPSLSVNNTSGAAGIYSVALGGGIFGETMSDTAYGGVEGVDGSAPGDGTGVYGYSPSGAGVFGNSASGLFGWGVYGQGDVGMFGVADQAYGTGVFGLNVGMSITGITLGLGEGIWGDGGVGSPTNEQVGVVGTVDDGNAAVFENNSPSSWDTVFISSNNSAAYPLVVTNTANGKGCSIDPSGNIDCTGVKNAIVPIDGGARVVALSAIESPKVWFEDFGSARLTNGAVVVQIDPEFTQTVNTEQEYQVFLTPYGDCKGLYVSNRTSDSFEVHELAGGTTGVSFGYRITALRRKFEDVRFADHTQDLEHIKRFNARTKTNIKPAAHVPHIPVPPERPALPAVPPRTTAAQAANAPIQAVREKASK